MYSFTQISLVYLMTLWCFLLKSLKPLYTQEGVSLLARLHLMAHFNSSVGVTKWTNGTSSNSLGGFWNLSSSGHCLSHLIDHSIPLVFLFSFAHALSPPLTLPSRSLNLLSKLLLMPPSLGQPVCPLHHPHPCEVRVPNALLCVQRSVDISSVKDSSHYLVINFSDACPSL